MDSTPTESLTPQPRSRRPSLHPRASTSSLRYKSPLLTPAALALPPQLSVPTAMESNPETAAVDVEAILVNDVDGEAEDDLFQSGHEESNQEHSQKLREQLRSLSTKGSQEGMVRARPVRRPTLPVQDLTYLPDSGPQRQFFVLTHAGKPVFISSKDSEKEADHTSAIGVMQAIISVFADEGDKIKCINAPPIRMTFLIRSPLYYVCVSSLREPESITRIHLEYLHFQILSVVSASQLQRIFERRTGFDLRRLLEGTETFLHTLVSRLPSDLAVMTASLHSLRMDPTLRTRAAEALVPTSKMKDMLYAILIAADKVVTLVRPRKHSIHPADLHILLSTVASPSLTSTPASWIPICLPKFNPSGFLHAFASFLRPQTGVTLVLISASGEFEPIKNWSDTAIKNLESNGTLDAVSSAARSHDYSADELGIPGLRHFLYKSRTHVQITMPTFEDPYSNLSAQHRLINLYQTLYDAIHAKSGQDCTLKLQYIRTEKESVMGWITQQFEIYVALSPRLPKSAAVGAANAVVRWVKKEEGRLVLRDAPVF